MANVPASKRREQLISAASRVISRKGVAGTTTRDVTSEAGVAQAIFHYVFKSKDELLVALARLSDSWIEQMVSQEKIPDQIGLRKAVRHMMIEYNSYARSDKSAQYEILLWSLRTADHENVAKELYSNLVNIIAKAFRRAAGKSEQNYDFARLAKLVLIFSDGTQIGNLFGGDSFIDLAEIDNIADATVAMAKPKLR